MTSDGKDSVEDLERLRRRLEEIVENHRKSLRNWQLWEAEYDGFKDELLQTPVDVTGDDMVAQARSRIMTWHTSKPS